MDQVIVHIDLDFFYGQVEQAKNPSLVTLPFAIQQKHIVVTCNYLARAAGVRKLQLLTDAKHCCPGLIIINGEDIQPYRDASKAVFRHIRSVVGEKVQRLGMDELWLDVTDLVMAHYSSTVSDNCFTSDSARTFSINKSLAFDYTAGSISGHLLGTLTKHEDCAVLGIASHLAAFLRESIRSSFSFTSSAGISRSKLLAKLVGDHKKPNDQTVILPDHHQIFLDSVEVKKIAGVGYKILSVLYEKLHTSAADPRRTIEIRFEDSTEPIHDPEEDQDDHSTAADLVDDGEEFKLISKQKEALLKQHKQPLRVRDVRATVTRLDLVTWFGQQQGEWLHDIIHAIDTSIVVPSSLYPKSIGVEDSFLHCTTIADVRTHLLDLTFDLIHRIEGDLMENDKFVLWPSTLRLTPRFRGDQEKGELWRHKRTTKSVAFPIDALATTIPMAIRAASVVDRVLMKLFSRIAAEKTDWDLSLLNVGVAEFKSYAPAVGITEYFTESFGKRKRAMSTTSSGLCPAGVDPQAWTALDEQTRKELLSSEQHLHDQTFESVPDHGTEKRVRFHQSSEPVETSHISGGSDEGWPDEETGVLCPRCNSEIPDFAMADHICVS